VTDPSRFASKRVSKARVMAANGASSAAILFPGVYRGTDPVALQVTLADLSSRRRASRARRCDAELNDQIAQEFQPSRDLGAILRESEAVEPANLNRDGTAQPLFDIARHRAA
jgi:hypothetical protein